MRSDNRTRAAAVAFAGIVHLVGDAVQQELDDAPYQKKPQPDHTPHQGKRERERRLRQMAKLNNS